MKMVYTSHIQSIDRSRCLNIEPPRGKTNNVVSKQVRHKPACTSTEDGLRLEILDLESRGIVTAKLICVFVFAYAVCWFSHEEALLSASLSSNMNKMKK